MKKYLLVVSAAVLLFVTMAWAQQEYPGYGGGYGGMYGPYYAPNLKLTNEQETKLNDLQTKYLTDIQNIDTQIAQKNLEMRRLLSVAKPDSNAIDKIESDIMKLQNKRYDITLDYRNKARSILTDEQLKNYPYAFYGPGICPYHDGYGGMMGEYGGYGPGYGGMMGGYGRGYGGGMMRGWGW